MSHNTFFKPQSSLNPVFLYQSAWCHDNPLYQNGINRLSAAHQMLVAYSGKDCRIHVSRDNGPGSAHPFDVINLDVKILNYSLEVIAFVLAHEWGHQVLGHLDTPMTPENTPGREDEADVYAAKFQATHNFDIQGVFELNNQLNPHTSYERNEKIRTQYNHEMMALIEPLPSTLTPA